MSFHPLDWAYSQQLKPATKFVLVSMAKVARPEYFAAVSTLCDMTGLDKKTVYAALRELAALRLITDTGKRVGRTSQIVVWKLSTEDTQKRKCSRNGSVPFLDLKVPKNGIRRKVPKNGIRNKEIKIKKKEGGISCQREKELNSGLTSLSDIMQGLRVAAKGIT